jgi:hypothetical protein
MISLGRGHFLDRHLSEIRQRIDCPAEAANGTHIAQFEMIRSHPAVTDPANQAVNDPVLAS